MGGTTQHGDLGRRPVEAAAEDAVDVDADPAAQVVPLLQQPAVWIDPPDELGDEVVESVRAERP